MISAQLHWCPMFSLTLCATKRDICVRTETLLAADLPGPKIDTASAHCLGTDVVCAYAHDSVSGGFAIFNGPARA